VKAWFSRLRDALFARRRNFANLDLHGADLSARDLHASNFSRTNLTCANLERANLRRCNFAQANLSGASLRFADLYAANLRGACLSGADLGGAILRRASLKGARVSMHTRWPERFRVPSHVTLDPSAEGGDLTPAVGSGSGFHDGEPTSGADRLAHAPGHLATPGACRTVRLRSARKRREVFRE
jgi:uncharacterized protein YjbI with pentapeptide repeats